MLQRQAQTSSTRLVPEIAVTCFFVLGVGVYLTNQRLQFAPSHYVPEVGHLSSLSEVAFCGVGCDAAPLRTESTLGRC